MTTKTQFMATGRRKNSVARVRVSEGTGTVTVNERPFNAYFPRESNRLIIMQPLELAKLDKKIDVLINVSGGGLSGQAGAVKQGIARALVIMDENLKKDIKKAGFLTRDARMRERKKYGRKRARRRFQFTKR
jgi:small subunit ribosomal protein S9